jgi:serine/threonine protein kinase
MLIGEHVFQAGSDDELALLIVRGRYVLPTTLSAASVELLERMMECDPQRRLPMRAVKAHPWLADRDPPAAQSPG